MGGTVRVFWAGKTCYVVLHSVPFRREMKARFTLPLACHALDMGLAEENLCTKQTVIEKNLNIFVPFAHSKNSMWLGNGTTPVLYTCKCNCKGHSQKKDNSCS